MFLTLLCSGGEKSPPSPGINPKVSCNENSKGKIYDENKSKKLVSETEICIYYADVIFEPQLM